MDKNKIQHHIEKYKSLPGGLLPLMHAIQDELGYIPEETYPLISQEMSLSVAEIHGFVSFYHHFRTKKTGKNEAYNLHLKATDALGAFVTKSKRLDAKKPDEPPQITNINIPGSMSYRGNVSVKGTGRDSDGNDDNLRWNVHRSGGDGYISGFSPYSTKGKSFSTNQYMKNNVGRYNPFTISVVLTDEDGLQSSANRRVTMNPDPLVFDLNGDGKVELVGSEMVSKGVQVPPGLWDVKVVSVPDSQSRFTVADANQGQGEFNAQVGAVHSLNSSGRWKLGGSIQQGEQWTSQDLTASSSTETNITVQGGGFTFELIRTSDGGYKDDGTGITTSEGEMVLFDLDPNKSSKCKAFSALWVRIPWFVA